VGVVVQVLHGHADVGHARRTQLVGELDVVPREQAQGRAGEREVGVEAPQRGGVGIRDDGRGGRDRAAPHGGRLGARDAAVLEQEPAAGRAANLHLRDRRVSADLVSAEAAKLETLECRAQELISWDESSRLIDCISSFVRCGRPSGIPTARFDNPDFYRRACELKTISERYR
jgi:hypothetical protein